MSQKNAKQILIVDDSKTVRKIIAMHLDDDYDVLLASDGEQAWQFIESNDDIVLVFSDMHMPVMNGMLLLKRIRESSCSRISQLPVIMITGHDNTDAAKQASYHMGATDFISKPFSALDINSRVNSYTKLNQKIQTLEDNVTRDTLTGLLNHRGLIEFGDKAMAGALRHKHEISILAMQIAELDQLTSSYGIEVTEEIIDSVADELKSSMREEETLAHFDSGKFVIILPMTEAFKAHIVALRIQKAVIDFVFYLVADKIRVKIAIGISSTEGHHEKLSFSELLEKGDEALQISLLQRACKIVRHDEMISEDDAVPEVTEVTDEQEQSAALDEEDYGKYMMAILKGDFDAIPEQHIEVLAKPLQEFLNFTNKRN